MKRLLLYILFVTILSGAVLAPAGAVFAQGIYTQAQTGGTGAGVQTGATSGSGEGAETNCSGTIWGTIKTLASGRALECTGALVSSWALWISARTLWIAGVLLDITLDRTLNMSNLLNDPSHPFTLVSIGWQILRDVANIVFIFIALWSGISITLGIKPNEAWGHLAQMVLVALFINFSLFITQAVVDVSNVAALHFYERIVNVEQKSKGGGGGGLSEAFMRGLNLQTLYNTKAVAASADGAGGTSSYLAGVGQVGATKFTFTNIMLIGIFGSVFMVVAAFVFFAAAVLFLIRAITLMMLMILSPLAFVGLLLPGASGMAHEWWHKLWSQAFFAPLYMALAYIVVRAINDSSFQKFLAGSAGDSGTNFASAFTGFNAGSINIIFGFLLLIGLMVGCLIVAQSLGAKGSDMAMAGFDKLKGGLIGVAGAGVRGIIKAPSTIARGAGGFATGGASRWVGSKLMSSKLLRGIGLGGWAARKGQEYTEEAKKMKESKFGQIIGKVATRTGNALDVRHLEERAGQTWLGNTALGQTIRGMTTGALANVQIGNKSLQEVYEEDKHRESARLTIEERGHAVEGAGEATEARRELDASRVEQAILLAIQTAGGAGAVITALDAKVAAGTATENEKKMYDTAKKYESASVPEFEEALKKSGEAVEVWEKTLRDAKGKISEAIGKISPQEFLHLFPRELFNNRELMNINVLGEDKFNALVEDEHFSEQEKEGFTHARYVDIEEESHAFREQYDGWQKAQVEYTREIKKFKEDNGITALETAIERAEADLVAAGSNPLLVATATHDLENAKKALKTKEKDLATAKIVAPLAPKSPDWKDKDVYRGLRNMRNVRELENVARFMPELLEQDRFISTLSQGMVDRFRESAKVGSAQKTQVRMKKSYYISETEDLLLGLDPQVMRELEKSEPTKATKMRAEREKKITENKEEFQNTFLVQRNIDGTIKLDASGKPIRDEELWARHQTGMRLMPDMFGHKADDEIGKMPGAQRNLYGVRRLMGRGATRQFSGRDEGDDKRPLVAFMLDQLKQAVVGNGELTAQNIETLKWFINDRDGKNFANFDLLDQKYRGLLEISKAIYGTGEQALQSQLTKKQALEELGKLRKGTLSYGEARKLFKIAGDEAEYS